MAHSTVTGKKFVSFTIQIQIHFPPPNLPSHKYIPTNNNISHIFQKTPNIFASRTRRSRRGTTFIQLRHLPKKMVPKLVDSKHLSCGDLTEDGSYKIQLDRQQSRPRHSKQNYRPLPVRGYWIEQIPKRNLSQMT